MASAGSRTLLLVETGQGRPERLGVAGPEAREQGAALGAQLDQAGPPVEGVGNPLDEATGRPGCR